MLAMSWATFRERWQLFAGAILTVSVGVALVQASLLTLVAAVAPSIPEGLSATQEIALNDRLAGAVTLLGTIVGISVFVAFFVVGSTFSFTVAQRSRDFALLRLVGASRRQVRRLLLGEALLLGTVGTILGVFLGIPIARFEAWMLQEMEFVPPGFEADWHSWILAVSAVTGIGVAAVGSLGASHRASRVRPLEALRETGRADRVMTLSRWVIGLIALAGATALMVNTTTTHGDPLGPSLPGLIVAIIALSAFSPLVVPLVGGVLGALSRILLPRSQIGELVYANLRDGVRRSASTAAPVVMLVGLVVGFSGAINVVSAGAREEAVRTLDGDLIVTATEPIGQQLVAIQGVLTVSEEVPLRLRVDSADTPSRFEVNAIAISPTSYEKTHLLKGLDGTLADLRGEAVALDDNFASGLHAEVGDVVQLRLDGARREVEVVAIYPYSLSGSPVLLPIAFAPPGEVERRYIVQIDELGAADGVAEQMSSNIGRGLVSVSPLAEWIQDDLDNQQRVTQNFLLAVLGLVTLYIVIATINATVIAAAARPSEFATARLTGMSRPQVVLMALWESLIVVTVGVTLGAIAAAATIVATTAAVTDIVGTRVVAIPWTLFGAVTLGAVAIVSSASVFTTLAATRQPPIVVAGARE
jgi:putative ABC transport system permease protein